MRQGEIYWIEFRGRGSEPKGKRPAVVIQDDRFNRSTIQTTIVAALTSNLMLASVPGNVRLKKGEANLTRASVVNLTQIRTMDRDRLKTPIGALSRERVRQILDGLGLVFGWR